MSERGPLPANGYWGFLFGDLEVITTIALGDQVLAILRVWRTESFRFRSSADIATTLEQNRGNVACAINDLYNGGIVCRFNDGQEELYRVTDEGERTPGCCCCCNLKLHDPTRPFCETCGPEFDGRI